MILDTTTPATRRTLLAGVGGALVAVVAQAFGRPLSARAEGETMKVGGDHFTATSATQLKNTATDNDIFIATSTHGGRGVYGKSTAATGVEGRTGGEWPAAGVRGVTADRFGTAVRGDNEARGTTGILGGNFAGVRGIGGDQYGVTGESKRVGVNGTSPSGVGVSGFSPEGVGIEAVAPHSGPARALRVSGRATFTRSGVTNVPAGTDRVVVSLVPVTEGTFTIATLQQYREGVHVAAAVSMPAQDKVLIRLNRVVSVDTKVAYHVLET